MTPLFLNNKNEVPNGGFRYHQAETNFTVTGPTWSDLLINVKKHRVANSLPIGLEFERQIEQQLAEKLPSNFVTAQNPIRTAEVPREEWPLWAKGFALVKSDSDKGVGDTIERVVGSFGGEAVKRWHESIFGHPCNCTIRKAQFNLLYVY